MTIEDRITKEITDNHCILFMKGSADLPQCGFSAEAVSILRKHQVVFKTLNILEDQALRAELKTFSDWPTFPQLYIKGEFMGGVDIMREMDAASELAEALA